MRKILVYFVFALFLSSCESARQDVMKKNNSDEFLVEKKNPLVMPPNFNELPNPENLQKKNDIKEFKDSFEILKNQNDNHTEISKTLEQSVLSKID